MAPPLPTRRRFLASTAGLALASPAAPQIQVVPEEVANLALSLVKIPSPTGEEGAVGRFFAGRLESIGLKTHHQPVAQDRFNVIGRLAGSGGGKSLLLYGHLDTIPAQGCVLPRKDARVVWGRGAADMKGPLAAMLVAAQKIVDSGQRLKGDLWVAGAAGHEVAWPLVPPPFAGGDGTRILAQAIRSGQFPTDFAIIAEGPMETIGVAQGGGANFRLTITGDRPAVHTSTIPLSSSPTIWMADVLQDLYAYNQEIQGERPHPLIASPPRIEIGMAGGGDFYNRNPTHCQVAGYRRWNPDRAESEVEQEFRSRLEGVRRRLIGKYRDPSVNFDLFWRTAREAADAAAHPGTQELVRVIQKQAAGFVGFAPALSGSRMVSDLPFLFKDAGVPSVHYGLRRETPPELAIGGGHTDNEGVLIDDLARLTNIYIAVITDVCGG